MKKKRLNTPANFAEEKPAKMILLKKKEFVEYAKLVYVRYAIGIYP
ncbi:MAG: hypothetical protein OWQ47_00790 [Acidianus infernus]|nr:hypothetical protein [Acidianus infernus]